MVASKCKIVKAPNLNDSTISQPTANIMILAHICRANEFYFLLELFTCKSFFHVAIIIWMDLGFLPYFSTRNSLDISILTPLSITKEFGNSKYMKKLFLIFFYNLTYL